MLCAWLAGWLPQINGVAIYHHHVAASDSEESIGGEYMVSTVVRGSPLACLQVLRCRNSNTTLLGPAVRRQVLQRPGRDGQKEVGALEGRGCRMRVHACIGAEGCFGRNVCAYVCGGEQTCSVV